MRCCLDLVVFRVGVGLFSGAVQKQKPRASPSSIEDGEATRFQNHRVDLARFVRSNHLGSRTSYQVREHNQQIADIFDQRFFLSSSVVTTHTTFHLMTLESYDSHFRVLILSVPCNSDHFMAKKALVKAPMSMSRPSKSLTGDRCIVARWRKENPPKVEVKTKGTQAHRLGGTQ